MLTRVSYALRRALPAILLVVVGLLAALFRSRRGSRTDATTLVPISAEQAVPPVRRRGAVVALLVLLAGIGLILAFVGGDGALRRIASADGEDRRPVAALSKPDTETGRGKTLDAGAPGGSAAKAEPGQAAGPGAPSINAPRFDTVRVEPNGDLVVAGRAPPHGTVELLVDGQPTARVAADANGQFAIVPPALPTGSSEVGLRVTDGQNTVTPSRDSVVVSVSPSRDAKPLVALTSPDKPTVVLSQPDPSQAASRSVPEATSPKRTRAGTDAPPRQGSEGGAPGDGASRAIAVDAVRSGRAGNDGSAGTGASDRAASNGATAGAAKVPPASPPVGARAGGPEAPTTIVSVDAQEGGRLFVSGQAPAGATVRLYLNDTLIAPARVGRDGSVSFTIGRGIKPGEYKVRLDRVDAASGKVLGRAEVPFSVPDAARIAGTDRSAAAPSQAASDEDGGTAASRASQSMASAPDAFARPAEPSGVRNEPRSSHSAGSDPQASPKAGRGAHRPEAAPGATYVPEVKTARIERGDSLWAISRQTYGEGGRYTAIYDANQDQIRDPDLIYPGQVFVLPSEDAVGTVRDEARD